MKKILFTLAVCVLALNAKAETREQTIARNTASVSQLTKQEMAEFASERLPRSWNAYQIADAPKVYIICYDPSIDMAKGHMYTKQAKQDTFNDVLRASSYGCKAYDILHIVAFKK